MVTVQSGHGWDGGSLGGCGKSEGFLEKGPKLFKMRPEGHAWQGQQENLRAEGEFVQRP